MTHAPLTRKNAPPPQIATPRKPRQNHGRPPSVPGVGAPRERLERQAAVEADSGIIGANGGGSTLRVGALDHPAEREADRLAERALLGPPGMQPASMAPGAPGRSSVAATGSSSCPVSGELEQFVGRESIHGGRPLPRAMREDMEPRFSADFSRVRVHDNARSARLATEIGARAFAVSEHVFFNHGEFRPDAPRTRSLLAHELAHTIIARGGDSTIRRFPSGRAVAEGEDIGGAEVPASASEVKALKRWLRRIDVNRWIRRLEHQKKRVALGQWRLKRAQRVLALGLLQADEGPLRDSLRRFVELMQARGGASNLAPAAVADEPGAAEPESGVADDTGDVVSALERPEFFADKAAEEAANALVSTYRLKWINTDRSDAAKWTGVDLDLLGQALAKTPAGVHALVVDGKLTVALLAEFPPDYERPGAHTAQMNAGDGQSDLRISAQGWRPLPKSARVETILHEIGHGLHVEKPSLFTSFVKKIREGDLGSEKTRREVGGRAFENYLASGDDAEYFAHAFAVSALEPQRLPAALRAWTGKHFVF